jgi:hypothetical protein
VNAISWSGEKRFDANRLRRGAGASPRTGASIALPAGRGDDLHRHEPLVAQAVEDLALVRRVELAHRHRAAGSHRLVTEEGHRRGR